jgi:hypothetical protein
VNTRNVAWPDFSDGCSAEGFCTSTGVDAVIEGERERNEWILVPINCNSLKQPGDEGSSLVQNIGSNLPDRTVPIQKTTELLGLWTLPIVLNSDY